MPYVLKKFNVPLYASHFTMGLIEYKLEEHDILGDVILHRVEPRDKVEIGEFEVEFIRVSHSLIDCFALAINTPVGTLIHTGDYKVDETPVIGEPIDLRTLRRYGQEGVLALTSDSTNATVPGRTPSERAVIPDFEEIFSEAEGRIFVATFASSIHRLQIVIDVAQQFDRKVCVLGRSMIKNVEIAERLGYLDLHEGMLVSLQQAKKLPEDEIVYLVTGSQGEPRAALSQLSTAVYKGLTISEGDTVVLSARIIPGNERSISRLIGEIYKRGAAIIDEKRRLIHVSGHASQEDIRIMTEAVRPEFVVPVHGEYRMLYRHKEFLKNHCDFPEANIILIENGDMLELEARPREGRREARGRPHLHRRVAASRRSTARSSRSAASSPTTASSRPSSPSTRSRASWKASPRSSPAACSAWTATATRPRCCATCAASSPNGQQSHARRAPRLLRPQGARAPRTQTLHPEADRRAPRHRARRRAGLNISARGEPDTLTRH